MANQLERQFYPSAPWSRDLFSEVVAVKGSGTTLYLSGIGAEALGDQPGDVQHRGNVYAQTRLAYDKAKQLLSRHDASLSDVVKITAYLTDTRAFADYQRARKEAFGDSPPPSHTLLAISGLAWPGMLVEIDLIAVVEA